jgi:SEL1 protein
MATAFRHHSGIGTSRSCETAVGYYKQVADEAIKWYRSGPPGGRAWVRESFNIADEDGGVYGEGASSLVTGHVIRAHSRTDGQATLEDVLEYLDLMSSKGDYKATFSLGRLYYEGQRGLKQDFRAARRYFRHVADQYWRKDGTTQDTSEKPGLEKLASKAAGYLGQMFLRGDGVDTDYATALDWFRRGEKKGDATCQNGLGLLHLYGFGVRRDPVRAVEHFRAASEQDYAAAQVNLGALYLDQGQQADIHVAARYFELAARHNHIEALYYLGEMHHHGLGRAPSCGLAVAYYKMVSERVEPLVSSLTEAHEAYASGDVELALLDFIMAAEQGFEKAQANVAYLLDSQKSMLKWPSLTSLKRRRQSDVFRDKSLALVYWTRAAKQKNMDAMVKMGDYYLNGIGTPRDESKAASCYTAASEVSQSSQALYNLGWMHENGIGLTQDFHLAKRFYDHALESNPNAFLPVTLSLAKLRLRSAWNTLTRGRINSIQDEPGKYTYAILENNGNC